MNGERRKIRSYVRRQGRMSKLQQRAYNSLKERYCLPFSDDLIDFTPLFPGMDRIVVEIGFGMGAATADIAAVNPDTGYLGIEVHTPGVGKLLSEIERRGLANIRIVQHDAVEVLEQMIGDREVDGFHIFFPDPWPKKKHHKRRLIQEPFLALAASRLREEGYIYIVTDWEDYAHHIVKTVASAEELVNPYPGFAPSQPWRPVTRFEEKGREKKHPIFEIYATRRCPDQPVQP